MAPSHDVYKLGERLLQAIEKPGSVVQLAHEADFAADFDA